MAGKKSKRKQIRVKTPFSSPKQSPPHPPEVGASSPTDATCYSHPTIDASSKVCRHLEKGINVDKLTFQFSEIKFSITHCQDCAKESKSGAGKKGKNRSNRKKDSAVNASCVPHLLKNWVCLACGHVACGGFLNHADKKPKEQEVSREIWEDKVVPSGHVCKHSLCLRHPIALRLTDNLVWCFVCKMAVDCTASLGSSCNPLQFASKVVQEKLAKETGFVKDPGKEGLAGNLYRSNIVTTSQLNGLESSFSMDMLVTGIRRKRIIKGLINLGNTCFFNSVMQNLLALDMLREYFSQELPGLEGPLLSSLRKLFLETNLDSGGQLCTGASEPLGYESGLKKVGKGRDSWETGACNPKSLFGAICVQAPRFKGFQQQDSHELLRCLLEGLTSEERSARTKFCSSGELEESISSPAASQLLSQDGESLTAEPHEAQEDDHSPEITQPPTETFTTFVDSFFGGQLSSTVRCCECGHSSVVFERMLDLSLPIPNSKKGHNSVFRSELLSSWGGSQQSTEQAQVVPKRNLHKVLHSAGPAMTDANKTFLQGAQTGLMSMPPSAGASSPTDAAINICNDDDFGWLEFIGGGTQSAESSVQGSYDAPNTVEVSESNLALDLSDHKATRADNAEEISSTVNVEVSKDVSVEVNESNSAPNLIDPKTTKADNVELSPTVDVKVSNHISGNALSNAEEQDNKIDIARVEGETSLNFKEEKGEEPLSIPEGEDGPLPLASGILLLPYEPLEMSITSSACLESAPSMSLVDISSAPTDLEGGYLDGFSQLFEEEESFSTISENLKSTCKNLEESQLIDESAWDDCSWETDRAVYGPAPQRLADVVDASLPMSLEGCLADFTKSELLCGENARECESCTRRMKEKACSARCENLIDSLSIEDMTCGEKHEKLACIFHQNVFPLSCNGNGALEQVLPNVCESAIVGCDSNSIKGNSAFRLVVDHTIDEIRSGGSPLVKSDGDLCSVSPSCTCQMDSSVADTPNLDQDNKPGLQGNEGDIGLCPSALKSSIEEAMWKSCNDTKGSVNKENLTTSQNKKPKEGNKPKIKSKQPPEKLVKKDATKKMSISKAPPILTVHLKRFSQDMRGRLSKLSGHVTFPEILDLRPFLDPRCLDSNSCFYQLAGVVEHRGTMRGGHYIAYVRSPSPEEAEHEGKDMWYCVSDSSVHKSSLLAVLNSEAYLLFYEKCKVE